MTEMTGHPHYDFTVITPSFNMLPYLRRCCASVGDQRGISVQHLVIDGGSVDGSAEWLRSRRPDSSVIEPDEGMYDALNKGLERARGDYVCYLNCDEQHLPGALARAGRYFATHADIDVLFGGILLVRPDGTLIAHRKPYAVRAFYIRHAHLYVPPAAMFLRRRVLEAGLRFDKRYRTIGDMVFVLELLARQFRVGCLPDYFTAFTQRDCNLGGSNQAKQELTAFRRRQLGARRILSPLVNCCRRLEKLMAGGFTTYLPLRYALVDGASESRREFVATGASFRWRTG